MTDEVYQNVCLATMAIVPGAEPTKLVFGMLWLGVRVGRVGWKVYRAYEMYKNPTNLAWLAAGVGIDIAVGQRPWVQRAACYVYAANSVSKAAEEYIKIKLAWGEITSIKPPYMPRKFKFTPGCIPSEQILWQRRVVNFKFRIKVTVKCIGKIFLCVIKMSMYISDAVSALHFEGNGRCKVLESAVHGADLWKTLTSDESVLVKYLQEQKMIIERLGGGNLTIGAKVFLRSTQAVLGVKATNDTFKRAVCVVSTPVVNTGYNLFRLSGEIFNKISKRFLPKSAADRMVWAVLIKNRYIPSPRKVLTKEQIAALKKQLECAPNLGIFVV